LDEFYVPLQPRHFLRTNFYCLETILGEQCATAALDGLTGNNRGDFFFFRDFLRGFWEL